MKMHNKIASFLTIITFLVLIQFVGNAFPASIAINNPSFEDHNSWTNSDGNAFWNVSVVGWNLSDLGGPSLRGTINFITDAYISLGKIPDGENVAWSVGGVISQVLSDTLLGGYTYELQCYVGRRKDLSFPISYAVQLLAGGDILAQESSLSPSADQFLLSSLTYTSSSSDTHIGQPLEIRLIDYENTPTPPHKQILFDMVTLSASQAPAPLPTSIFLIGSGLILLLPFLRKTKR
jgi:hypothetical protein